MNAEFLRELLERVRGGELDVAEAARAIESRPVGDLGFATIDHDRQRRTGAPEVVFCAGKTPEQAAAIAREIFDRSGRVLLTRAERAHAAAVLRALPAARFHERARCITAHGSPAQAPARGLVAVVCAGTSDLPVAEEAAVTAELLGSRTALHADVGVAGLHRLAAKLGEIREAHAIVAVAGMEGALPSVLAGLVAAPVFAVPTSIGYGTSYGGLTALLAMLNSCAAGVAVVNVDNGFGAGYLASLVNLRLAETSARNDRPPSTR